MITGQERPCTRQQSNLSLSLWDAIPFTRCYGIRQMETACKTAAQTSLARLRYGRHDTSTCCWDSFPQYPHHWCCQERKWSFISPAGTRGNLQNIMTILSVGLQVFHNGVPVELLYQVRQNVWQVRPLFVHGEEREEKFCPHDTLSHLHTQPKSALTHP